MALTKVDISLMDNIGTTANKLLAYDGSGNLPAVDGSQLINVNTGVTNSASDPVITTNPSGGVGTQWNNTTSGEVYVCTDATAGENVWTNIGAGTGNVQPWGFQGTAYGYHFGSNDNDNGSLQKYSFTSDGNATDLGTVTVARNTWVGFTAETHGYNHGGHMGSTSNVTDKFNMSTDANSTDVGDMLVSAHQRGGSSSLTYAYVAGSVNSVTNIDKHSFATDGNATDVGDLAQGLVGPAGTQV